MMLISQAADYWLGLTFRESCILFNELWPTKEQVIETLKLIALTGKVQWAPIERLAEKEYGYKDQLPLR